MRLTRHRLATRVSAQDALRALRGDRLPFCLLGAWAGGGAILGSEPLPGGPSAEAGAPWLGGPSAPAVDGPPGAVGGGWVGWLGFGAGAWVERLDPPPPRPHPLPLAHARFYDHVLRLDPDGAWWFEALETPARAAALAARRADLAARLGGPVTRRPWRLRGMTPRAPGYDGHRWAVRDAVRRIAAGELFQANVCLRLDGALAGDPLDAFADASATLRPARGAFVTDGAGHALLSFSPELFLRRTGARARSAPIKGTAPRDGAGGGRERLAASAKDAAEHVMIVDLVRNDLGRVARYGSVQAHAPAIEPHPGLWHLVSRVEADLRDGATDADLVRAAFPPGSVTGAPKIQALHTIAGLEGTAREAYTGAIGIRSPVAGLELNVAIRTLEVAGGHAWFGAGGGVVADSDADGELREALAKARPVLAALGATVPAPGPPRGRRVPPPYGAPRPDPALGLLETALVQDTRIAFLEDHLDRLAASAVAEGVLPATTARAAWRAAALDAARAAPPGRHRLRLVLLPDGTLTVELAPAGDGPAPATLHPVCLPGGLGDRKWADRRGPARWERPALGLLVDGDGAVLEATSANVFLVEDGRYVTPPADGRILPGVTRARLLAHTGAAEEEFGLDRLAAADAVLLTSAIALVTPVGAAAAPLAADLRRAVSAPSPSAPPPAGRAPSRAPGR